MFKIVYNLYNTNMGECMKGILKLFLLCLFMLVATIAFGQATGEVIVPVETPINYVVIIAGCLLAISECLASLKVIQANSIFQLIVNVLKTLAGK